LYYLVFSIYYVYSVSLIHLFRILGEVMSFWSKLGKIAITAAPYVAAPFTGGASLLAVPAANKAVSAWSQHDANVAAGKGLAPSSFDKYLGMAGGIAGMAGGAGAFGGLGDSYSAGNFTGANPANSKFGNVMNAGMAGVGIANAIGNANQSSPSNQSNSTTGIGPTSVPSYNSSNPDIAGALNAGKRQAIRNQPFRAGYDISWPGADSTATNPTTVTNHMPSIFSPKSWNETGRRNRNQSAEATQ
jgi:hypothetical protein